ncbi:hypothetical protein GpartN1_g7250.t1 [Galdieria partita]|uniref:AMP deaminase n=1 Tax=Galdieria partita TaxID=83374 RepID=A0A9C7UTM4_9RHOD|nr:hypothetical protein GpartN1_g7250.t1 [Galdieria partita]
MAGRNHSSFISIPRISSKAPTSPSKQSFQDWDDSDSAKEATQDVDTLDVTPLIDRTDEEVADANFKYASLQEAAANFRLFSDKREEIERSFQRLVVSGGIEEELSEIELQACQLLTEAIRLREQYIRKPLNPEWQHPKPSKVTEYTTFVPPPYDPFTKDIPPASSHCFSWKRGILRIFANAEDYLCDKCLYQVPSFEQFGTDLQRLMTIVNDPDCRSFCYKRLMFLSTKDQMHRILNSDKEQLEKMTVPHRDFYNVRKVDTHVHHSSCMNQKHLLRFIKSKLKKNPDEPVLTNREDPSKPPLTLREVFDSLHLTAYDLSVDTLDVHADNSTFHRFDRFNLKYSPFGHSRLREIFLKTDNYIQGKYLAEMTREVFEDLKENKYQNAEYRISIYGKSYDEWDRLAQWFERNKIYSDNVRWLIQIPRLFNLYKENRILHHFQEMLENIFTPLIQVTIDPSSHPSLHRLLQQVVGFDSVDDESVVQPRLNWSRIGPPAQWTFDVNPPYSYYSYYIYANLYVLNKLREARGFSTFRYRPHAGEAGDMEHLAVCFLLADGINHGIKLRKSPPLQYLYYLCQIGLAMSPLSNNLLFMEYFRNPLPIYFARGLNVSISSDDPLQFHFTKEPLMEEYSVAAQVWKFSNTDLAELARNSVLQSGFEACVKEQWIGKYWYRPGAEGNDIQKTGVANIRLRYRFETLMDELALIFRRQVPTDIHVLPNWKARWTA